MNDQNDLQTLMKEVNNSSALKVYRRLVDLKSNFYCLGINHLELSKFITHVRNNEVWPNLLNPKYPRGIEITLNETARLLQNYLASASALVDQTRALIDSGYKSHSFHEEYENQIKNRFVGNPIIGFVEDLRNYSLHYSLPVTGANLTFNQNESDKISASTADFILVLDRPSLLLWSNWSTKGKPFLNKITGNQIELSSFVDPYFNQVNEFHQWMFFRIQEIHSKELSWLEEKDQRIRSLMPNKVQKGM